jgi:hypothetical protein
MTGIQFVTDDKGRKTAVLIDLKRHGALWQEFWDGMVSESRRKEKSIPYEEYRAARLKRGRRRGTRSRTKPLSSLSVRPERGIQGQFGPSRCSSSRPLS